MACNIPASAIFGGFGAGFDASALFADGALLLDAGPDVALPVADTGPSTSTADASAEDTGATFDAQTDTFVPTYLVAVTVTGLAPGASVVLQENGADNLTLSSNGAATFSTPLLDGAPYQVSVLLEPMSPSQNCSLTNAAGLAGPAIVTVAVVCTTNTFLVGGTVSGLSAGNALVVTDNGGDVFSVTSSGPFAFPEPTMSGGAFDVAIATQPASPAQTCSVSAGTGTVGAGPVTSIAINCTTNVYTVGGTLTGLAPGDTVVLQEGMGVLVPGDGQTVTVSANGAFAFPTPIGSGLLYTVGVASNPQSPTSQSCIVTSGAGAVGGSNVTDVTVACTTTAFAVGGTVTGLAAGDLLLLENNDGDALFVSQNGPFSFPTRLMSGAPFQATVGASPAAPTPQTCAVAQAAGSVGTEAVTSITVTCVTASFSVGGVVSGLATGADAGGPLVLTDNGGDMLVITANGPFAFATPITSGGSYNVAVQSAPETCTVTNGTGSIGGLPIANVLVNCSSTAVTDAATDAPAQDAGSDARAEAATVEAGVVLEAGF